MFAGSAFRASLMHQAYNPPDVDLIFIVMDATPDLAEIFDQKKRRFFKRTSSAQWEEKWKPTLGLGTSQQSGGYFDGAIQYFKSFF